MARGVKNPPPITVERMAASGLPPEIYDVPPVTVREMAINNIPPELRKKNPAPKISKTKALIDRVVSEDVAKIAKDPSYWYAIKDKYSKEGLKALRKGVKAVPWLGLAIGAASGDVMGAVPVAGPILSSEDVGQGSDKIPFEQRYTPRSNLPPWMEVK